MAAKKADYMMGEEEEVRKEESEKELWGREEGG